MSEDSSDAGAANKSEPKKESIGEIFRTVVYALIIAMVFRTFLFQAFTIPSGSMKPTLLIGDYLLVSKYSYGYSRFSLPFGSRIPEGLFPGRIFSAEPERGDVIVFRNPENIKEDYIKRLIGTPGDRVSISAGQISVNGAPLALAAAEPFFDNEPSVACTRNGGTATMPFNCNRQIETLPNGETHEILAARNPDRFYADNTCEYVVPEGQYFFVGDNRNNSRDSRFGHLIGSLQCDAAVRPQDSRDPGIGYVSADLLVGRADVILLSSAGAFWEVWNWRFDRFFESID